SVFHHSRMATEISGRFFGAEIPQLYIFADQVIHPAGFATPIWIFPWTADRWDVLQPGRLRGNLFEFLTITEFVSMAGALHTKKPMLPRHRRTALSPILINRADVADVRSKACDGGQQEMVFPAASKLEREASSGHPAKKN